MLSKIFRKNKFIVLLLFFVFLFRIPSLFEPYWYGDEGIYLTLGMGIRKGLLLYKDIFDNKPPLIYLIAAVSGGSLPWFRLILMTSILSSIYFFYQLSLKIFDNKTHPAKISVFILAFFTSIRLFEGNVANAEIFILLPTIFALSLLLTKPFKKFFIAGMILSLGFLLKVPAVFDFLAILVFWVFYENHKRIINLGKREIFTALGYLIPIFLVVVYFWSKGALEILSKACFIEPLGYLSSWKSGAHVFSPIMLLKSELSVKGILVLFLLGLLWLKRKSLKPQFILIFIWFSFALFAATASGRPYPHYLIQVIPPLSLALALLFTQKPRAVLALSGLTISFLIISAFHYHFWVYSTFSYWQNFAEFVAGRKSKTSYLAYFNPKLPTIYRLAEFIKSNTDPQQKIFIWADEPYLYPLARRLPATAYVVAYHVIDLGRHEEVTYALEDKKASLVVFDKKYRQFTSLEMILKEKYLKIQTEGDFIVFRLKNI